MARSGFRRRSARTTAIWCALLIACALCVTAARSPAARSPAAAGPGRPAVTAASSPPVISVDGNGGDKPYQGIGAILGGGGNARYLMDYPATQRNQILDYLFTPGYGASLQMLKLEIGGGTNSTDGSEPSIEPVEVPASQVNRYCSPTVPSPCVNCHAGYEFAIAQQAVQRNPNIILYGLQWTAPAWVTGHPATGGTWLYTQNDITYLVDWLNCAKSWGLNISYLGGWNENGGDTDNDKDWGTDSDKDGDGTYQWYVDLRNALDASHFNTVKLIAGDLNPQWEFASPATSNAYPDINVLGTHDVCGYPTEDLTNGVPPVCDPPEDSSGNAITTAQPLWASELGAMDAGANIGCTDPCAPAMDRALVRGYHEANLTGYLEWPVLDAMPQTGSTEDDTPLPYENRGLITADQPWPASGSYTVNAMTWAIAQFTDFVTPPYPPGDPTDRWVYEDDGSGYLPGNGGAYVTLIHQTWDAATQTWKGEGWTTVVETTTATANQDVKFSISGGTGITGGLAGEPVHVWSSNFDFSSPFDTPQYWLWHRGDSTAAALEQGYTLQHGFVYTFTTSATNAATATSQAPGSASATPPPPTPPAPVPFGLPYTDSLATSGAAGPNDDEPQFLDAQDGSFEIVPCTSTPPGGYSTCTGQTTVGDASDPPVFWHPASSGVRYPYAIIGDGTWGGYTENVNLLLPQSPDGPTTGGLIGYYTLRADSDNPGLFDGFVFDLSTTGAWRLVSNSTTAGGQIVLDSGTFTAWPAGTSGTGWNKLTLSFEDGSSCGSPEPSIYLHVAVTASIDGSPVGSATTCALPGGLAGIEAGYTTSDTDNWPAAQYSDLSVTSP